MRAVFVGALALLGLVVVASACSADHRAVDEDDLADGGATATTASPAPTETTAPRADGDDPPGDGSGTGAATTALPGGAERRVAVGRPSIGPGGNRLLAGRAGLGVVEPVDVELPGIPVLVLPVRSGWLGPDGRPEAVPAGPAPRWLVELDDGERVVVDTDLAVIDGVGVDPVPSVDGFDDPLPDAVVVEADGLAVSLVQPTDRYPHGALGDRIEAAAVQVLGPGPGDRRTFGPAAPAVIEGLSAIVADATGDGAPEILVTESDADRGASLTLWSPAGEPVARSAAIGQGNRWRNQLAVAPVGPDGEIEVIDVRTPHIGGTVQYFRVEGDELVRVGSQTGFTSHRFGSRNLDLGAVFDAEGDGVLDVVVPTDRRDGIGILTRVRAEAGAAHDGVTVTATLDLPGRMTTNLAVGPPAEGVEADPGQPLAVAVGTDERILRIWPAPGG